MSREEIETLRQRYSKQWKTQKLEAIPWYGRKTAIRKLSPLLPKSPQFAAALQFDGDIRELEGDVIDDVPEAEYEIQKPVDASTPDGSHAVPTDPTPAAPEQPEIELTLEQAKATVLLGEPGVAWGGQAGKALDGMSSGHLKSIRTWCAKKLEKEGDDPAKQLMVDAITMILIDRDANPPAAVESEKPAIGEFPSDIPSEEKINSAVAENEARAAAVGL